MQLTMKAARVNAKFTQREAAERIGVTVATVGNWERGDREISARYLFRLADLYQIAPGDFILPNVSSEN